MSDKSKTTDPRIENAIYLTLQAFGMRLPAHHEGVGMDDRLELMRIMARRIARAVKEVTDAG